jgi:hypothetical protein
MKGLPRAPVSDKLLPVGCAGDYEPLALILASLSHYTDARSVEEFSYVKSL